MQSNHGEVAEIGLLLPLAFFLNTAQSVWKVHPCLKLQSQLRVVSLHGSYWKSDNALNSPPHHHHTPIPLPHHVFAFRQNRQVNLRHRSRSRKLKSSSDIVYFKVH